MYMRNYKFGKKKEKKHTHIKSSEILMQSFTPRNSFFL